MIKGFKRTHMWTLQKKMYTIKSWHEAILIWIKNTRVGSDQKKNMRKSVAKSLQNICVNKYMYYVH